jgi:tRNA(Ile2)-agmatinylcytidine synthase
MALAPKFVLQNTVCPKCGRRLESMGRDKGFRCKKCGTRFDDSRKVSTAVERDLKVGLHVTSTRSQRHLTKPLRRYGLEKHGETAEGMIEKWHSP